MRRPLLAAILFDVAAGNVDLAASMHSRHLKPPALRAQPNTRFFSSIGSTAPRNSGAHAAQAVEKQAEAGDHLRVGVSAKCARPDTCAERATSTRICMGDSRAADGGAADAAAPEAEVVAAPVAVADAAAAALDMRAKLASSAKRFSLAPAAGQCALA